MYDTNGKDISRSPEEIRLEELQSEVAKQHGNIQKILANAVATAQNTADMEKAIKEAGAIWDQQKANLNEMNDLLDKLNGLANT